MNKLRVLYVEDSPRDAELVLLFLKNEGLDIAAKVVGQHDEVVNALKASEWDLVLSDCHLPLLTVEEVLRKVRHYDSNLPFIAVSGAIGEEEAVSLLKNGAQDFVSKNNLSRLAPAIRRELHEAESRCARKRAEKALKKSEERFKLAMRGANDGLWDWSLGSAVVYYSPRWMKMLGYGEQELPATMKTFEQLLHPADKEQVFKKVGRWIKKPVDRYEMEYRMRMSNGEYASVLSRGFVYAEEGVASRIIGTHVDITERKRTELALLQSKKQLRELGLHIQKVREEEKAYIAQEVHDELGATLTALNVDIHWLEHKLSDSQEEMKKKISDMSGLVATAAEACSRIVTELRPSVLNDLGLLAALEWQAKEFSQRCDIPCQVSTNLDEITMENDRAIAVFRICQEALTNIARHASATRIEVIVLQQGNTLLLQIADDGVGLPAAEPVQQNSDYIEGFAERRAEVRKASAFAPGSYGIRGMGERALFLGGKLHLESEPGEGTRVVLRVPIVLTQGE